MEKHRGQQGCGQGVSTTKYAKKKGTDNLFNLNAILQRSIKLLRGGGGHLSFLLFTTPDQISVEPVKETTGIGKSVNFVNASGTSHEGLCFMSGCDFLRPKRNKTPSLYTPRRPPMCSFRKTLRIFVKTEKTDLTIGERLFRRRDWAKSCNLSITVPSTVLIFHS